MKKDELINYLDLMKDYYLYPENVSQSLKMPTPSWFRDDYTAAKDERLQNILNPMPPGTKKERIETFSESTFAIIANMVPLIRVPSERQLIEMMKICEYDADDMFSYTAAEGTPSICSVKTRGHLRVVILLSRAFLDAVTDDSGWKSAQPEQNPAMERLKALVDYMKENDLFITAEGLNEHIESEYDNYLKLYAKYLCMGRVCSEEQDIYEDRIRKKIKETQKTAEKAVRKQTKKEAMVAARNISSSHAKTTDARMKCQTQSGSEGDPIPSTPGQGKYLPTLPNSRIAPSIPGYTNYTIALGAQVEKKLGNAPEYAKKEQQKLTTLCDMYNRATEQAMKKWDVYRADSRKLYDATIFDSDVAAVSAGLFSAVVNGDTLYKTPLGILMFTHVLDITRLPVPNEFYTELSDNNLWHHFDPRKNEEQHLTIPIIKEDDVILVEDKVDGNFDQPIPLMSYLSRYANRPLENSLSIRKSLVEELKKRGLSDQLARDCAVMVAAMESATRIELGDYTTFARYPKESDYVISNQPVEQESEPVQEDPEDDRVEVETRRREAAERDLRQAKKENKACRHEVNVLKKEIAKLQAELEDARDRAFIPAAEDEGLEDDCDDTDTETFEFPYVTDKKLVLYGGFEHFQKDIQKYFPDIRVVEMSAHIDLTPIRNADYVFIQYNKTSHSAYWTVCDACRNSNTPYYHLNYGGVKRCAAEMVQKLESLEEREAG